MNISFRLITHFTTSALNLVNIRHIHIFKTVLCNLCFSSTIIINMPIFFTNNSFRWDCLCVTKFYEENLSLVNVKQVRGLKCQVERMVMVKRVGYE